MSVARSSVFRYASIILTVLMLATSFGPVSVGADPVRPGPDDTEVDPGGSVDPFAGRTGTLSVMIELADAPSGVVYADAKGQGAPETAAVQEAQSQKARVDQAQQGVLGTLAATVPSASVIYRVQAAYNGIAVQIDAANVPQLRGLVGVKAVHPITPMVRDHATSVPLIGAPTAWQSYGKTGAGIRIGVIDTGIDYVHTNFGGSGTAAAYAIANNPNNNLPGTALPIMNGATPLFPNAKVVGGWDFAGGAYNGNNTPAPDPNPQDCAVADGGGHGSHVAGTAAGYGVRDDGSTYPGPYDNTVPFDTMRIGPGVAPQASLYALRVFGCTGSTDLTVQAIDWAMDPNGDGDLSDHLDVINMSLGSAYGKQDYSSSVASNNAAAAGVIVANSAGNNGDLYYVSGSPGSAARAITVASSVDTTDVVDGFQATTPPASPVLKIATFSVAYDWPALTTPITADLVYNVSGNTTGCTAFPGSLAGKVVLADWAPAGTSTSPCGSVVRTTNAQAAGAAGIIMASGQTFFDVSITGNSGIPAVFTTHTVGSELKSALGVGTTAITFSYAYQGSGKFVSPGADDTLSTFSSRGPRGGDSGLKPDISAPGQSIFSTASGTGNRGFSNNGTSMAAPHIAGVMALLRQQHPTWSVEELKALAMNTAGNDLYTGPDQTGDKYGPARVGAGRVDVPAAVGNEVVAFVADDSGQVSVSFGALEVVGTLQQDRTVRVVNKGMAPATYTLGYDPRTTIPGVDYSFPDGNAITVDGGESATFRVRLTANAALMRNTRDSTVAGAQGGNPRQWLSEASGLITLTPDAGTALRVPVYATARPASNMTTEQSQLVFPGPTGTASLNLTGQGVDTGNSYPTDITSLVTGLELAATSGLATLGPDVPESARNADLRHVGVMAARTAEAIPSRINNSTIYFGIATHGSWSTPASEVEFDIYIDVNQDGTDDYVLYNTRLTDTDVLVTSLVNLQTSPNTNVAQGFTNVFSSNQPTAPFNSNVLLMPVKVTGAGTGLNFGASGTRFDYRVYAYSRATSTVVDQTGKLTYDYANPGLDFRSGGVGAPVYYDLPGNTVPATFNQTAYIANNSQGALLLHHYNATGSRAQVLTVGLAQTIDFAPPASKTYGDPPFVVSATGGGSGQPILFATTTPAVCASVPATSTSATITILAAGDCTIIADQAGDATYAAAPQVARTVAVAKATQTITFPQPPAKVFGDPPFTVTASATSGLPVAFGTTTPAVCAVGAPTTPTSTTVTILAAGDCTITAGQAGDANYTAAPQVARTVGAAVAPVALTVTTQGPGTVSPGSGSYPVGTAVTLTASPSPGAVFLGWTVDGVAKGWANPLAVTMDAPHSVVASFAVAPVFPDVPGSRPDAAAIAALASRDIIQGYEDGRFGPDDGIQRAQMAALIARATPNGPGTPPTTLAPPACLVAGTWDCEDWGNAFTDRGGLVDPLWRNIGTLGHYGVAKGYTAGDCAELGEAFPCFGPTDPVTYAQTVTFIVRMMEVKGYWLPQPGAPVPAGVPSVHAADVATFVHYTGGVPAPSGGWDAQATRGWFAMALWAALDSYWSVDRVP